MTIGTIGQSSSQTVTTPPSSERTRGSSADRAYQAQLQQGTQRTASAAANPPMHAIIDMSSEEMRGTPEALSWHQFQKKATRAANMQGVMHMGMRDALNSLKDSSALTTDMRSLRTALENTSRNNEADDIGNKTNDLKQKLDTYQNDFDDYVSYRKHLRDGGVTAKLTDVKGNLFGKSPSAVVSRAAIQSLAVVGTVAALQAGTVEIMRLMYEKDPSLIPDDIKDEFLADQAAAATEAAPTATGSVFSTSVTNAATTNATTAAHTTIDMTEGMTPEQVDDIHAAVTQLPPTAMVTIAHEVPKLTDKQMDELIDTLVKPGSTYIDEESSTTAGIYATEGAVGFARGVGLAAADSVTEGKMRQNAFNAALAEQNDGGTSLAKTALQTAKASGKSQALGGLISLGVATAVGLGTQVSRGEEGGKIATEFGKNTGFITLAGAANTLIDVLRKTTPGLRDLKGGKQQGAKAALRVGARIALQYAKTGIAVASGSKLPHAQIWNTRNLLQAAVGGTVKEGYGAAAQTLVEKFLPADEKLNGTVVSTLKSMTKLRRDIGNLENLNGPAEAAKQTVLRGLDQAAADVRAANDVSVSDADIQEKWDVFNNLLDTHVAGPTLENVVVTQPTQPHAKGVDNEGVELQEVVVPPSPRRPDHVTIDMPTEVTKL